MSNRQKSKPDDFGLVTLDVPEASSTSSALRRFPESNSEVKSSGPHSTVVMINAWMNSAWFRWNHLLELF